MNQCKFCGCDMITSKNKTTTFSHHRKMCVEYLKVIDNVITKDRLHELYMSGKTSLEIGSILSHEIGAKISTTTIIRIANRFGLKTPTFSDSAKLSMSKRAATNIKRYGAENVLTKGTEKYTKRNNTVMSKYGVNNVFELQSVKDKSKITMVEKYGVSHSTLLPNYKRNSGFVSIPHQLLSNYLTLIGVHHTNEIHPISFSMFNPELNKIYSPRPDIVLVDYPIVIEVYGDNWHANPKTYMDTDIIHRWEGDITAKEIRSFDMIRINHIKSFEYTVLEIWVSDISHRFEKVAKMISEEIEKYENSKNKTDNKNQKSGEI